LAEGVMVFSQFCLIFSKPQITVELAKFLSPPQADGVLRNFAPTVTDFAKAQNPRGKPRGIL
jgi:hypothetical protein